MLEFRLAGRLGDHGVALALLTGNDLNSRNNVSTVDLAHKIPENIVSHNGLPFTLNAAPQLIIENEEAKLGFVMSEGVASSRLFATNRASLRSGGRNDPLFFKYAIGRGAKAIYAVPEVEFDSNDYRDFLSKLKSGQQIPSSQRHYLVAVSEAIRNSITIHIRNKGPASISWDIDEIKPVDLDTGSQFFGRVFTANLYTSKRCNRGLTYVVAYNAYDYGLRQTITGHHEVLNAKPVADVASSTVIDADDNTKRVSVKVALNERLAKVLD